MSKKLIGMLLAIALLVGGFTPQTAQAVAPISITGIVVYQGVPQQNMAVMVECWDTGFVARPRTDGRGSYVVNTDQDHCPLGSTVKVRAETSDRVGFKFGTAQALTELNIELVPKTAVPEYGWAAAIAAMGAGVGVVVLVRRRIVRTSL